MKKKFYLGLWLRRWVGGSNWVEGRNSSSSPPELSALVSTISFDEVVVFMSYSTKVVCSRVRFTTDILGGLDSLFEDDAKIDWDGGGEANMVTDWDSGGDWDSAEVDWKIKVRCEILKINCNRRRWELFEIFDWTYLFQSYFGWRDHKVHVQLFAEDLLGYSRRICLCQAFKNVLVLALNVRLVERLLLFLAVFGCPLWRSRTKEYRLHHQHFLVCHFQRETLVQQT